MVKRKLNYRFHDPNMAEKTAGYILKVLIKANTEKVERAVLAAAETLQRETSSKEGCSA